MSAENKPKLTPVFDNLETALKIWWKNLRKFVLIYLWGFAYALVPMFIFGFIIGLKFWLGDKLSTSFNIASLIIFVACALVCALVLMYFAIRTYISLFLLVKNDYVGKELDIFKESGKYFWSYLGVVFPVVILTLFWSVLLIIPGIIFGIFYSLAVFIFFFEGKEGLEAISESKKLVKGYWWPVFGRYFLIGLISLVFSIVITAPISGKDVDSSGVFFQVWSFLVQMINYLVGPIYLIYVYNIYQDLVKIKK